MTVIFFMIVIIAVMMILRYIMIDKEVNRLAEQLTHEDREVRLSSIRRIGELHRTKTIRMNAWIVQQLLTVSQEDPDWQVRGESLKIIGRDLFSLSNGLFCAAQVPALPKEDLMHSLLTALHDEHPHVRARAAYAVGFFRDIRIVEPLLHSLGDTNDIVRTIAAETLKEVSSLVKTVVFSDHERNQPGDQQHTVWNLDVSNLHFPLPDLAQVVLDGTSCPLSLVEIFVTYLTTYFDDTFLKERVVMALHGDPTQLSPRVYDACHRCKRVDVAIDTIVFGEVDQGMFSRSEHALLNPDVSHLTIPMAHVKHVLIATETYDFQQVEYFLTYAINYLGQRYLKKHVGVHLYGALKHLHPNLDKNFRHVCKQVILHSSE